MKTWGKVGVGAAVVFVLASVALAVLTPALLREAGRVAGPIRRMKRSQSALEEMVERSDWRRPANDALTVEQLDRFFAVRRRLDTVRRHSDLELDRLPRKHVRSLEELRQVPGVIRGVSDVVGAEIDAFVQVGMTPEEYHWVERLVYERWRGPLRRAGTYPVAARAAGAEVDDAAGREPDSRTRARLKAVAEELRQRVPVPPEGFDPQIHALLLARLEDVERWSMDDVAQPAIPLMR